MDALLALPSGDFIIGVAKALAGYGAAATLRSWAATNTEFRSRILGQKRGRWDALCSKTWLDLSLGSADRVPRCHLDYVTAYLLDVNLQLTRDIDERQRCLTLLVEIACRHFSRMYDGYRLFTRTNPEADVEEVYRMLDESASAEEVRSFAEAFIVPGQRVTLRIFAPVAAVSASGDRLTFDTIERIERQFRLFVESYKPLRGRHLSRETLDLIVRYIRFLPILSSLPWASPEEAEPTYAAVRACLARCPSDVEKQKHGSAYLRTCVQHFFPHLRGCPDATVKRLLQYICKQGDLDKFEVIMRERWIKEPLTALQAQRMLEYLKVDENDAQYLSRCVNALWAAGAPIPVSCCLLPAAVHSLGFLWDKVAEERTRVLFTEADLTKICSLVVEGKTELDPDDVRAVREAICAYDGEINDFIKAKLKGTPLERPLSALQRVLPLWKEVLTPAEREASIDIELANGEQQEMFHKERLRELEAELMRYRAEVSRIEAQNRSLRQDVLALQEFGILSEGLKGTKRGRGETLEPGEIPEPKRLRTPDDEIAAHALMELATNSPTHSP